MVRYLFVLGVLFVVGCSSKNNGTKYVLAEKIEIEYYDSIRVDDWISIDDRKYSHDSKYESIKQDSSIMDKFYTLNLLPSTMQSVNVLGADSHEFKSAYDASNMAYELFRHLALVSEDSMTQTYKFSGHSLELSLGKLTLMRNDGEKIKVSTSEGYGAAVRKKN